MLGRRRFLVPDINPGAGNLFVAQRRNQCSLIMDEATRSRDEISVRLHQREFLSPDHAARAVVERTIDGYKIGATEQLVERDLDGAASGNGGFIEIGIAGEHLHLKQSTAKLGNPAYHIAQADNANGASLDVIAHERAAVAHG